MRHRALIGALLLGCGSTTVTDERTEHPIAPSSTAVAAGETVANDDGSEPPVVGGSPSHEDTVPWPTIETTRPDRSVKPKEPGRPRGDRSTALPGWDESWVRVDVPEDAGAGQVHGKVAELRAPEGGDKPGLLRIEGADGRSVALPVLGPGRLALAVGDVVTAKWRTSQIQIHTIQDIAVIDEEHRVVYVGSGNGDPSFAPGWHIESGAVVKRSSPHMRGGARRESRWLVLGKGDVAVFVHAEDGTRLLSLPEGEYAVSGGATTWSAGKRPPDSSEYEAFGIVRLR